MGRQLPASTPKVSRWLSTKPRNSAFASIGEKPMKCESPGRMPPIENDVPANPIATQSVVPTPHSTDMKIRHHGHCGL